MLTFQEVAQIHKAHWRLQLGSISAKEAFFLQEGIARFNPQRFVEVGTASGLSTGFIALFMSEAGGSELTTIDLDTTFWGDRSKPTGYLAETICERPTVSIDYIRERTSAVVEERLSRGKYDMGFIDANHQHPWPTFDTIALLPAMESGARIYHHDLALYRRKGFVRGVGPKYLFDQFPEDLKAVTPEPEGNIFYLRAPESHLSVEKAIISSLFLPWSNVAKIEDPVIQAYCDIADKHWSNALSAAIRESAARYQARWKTPPKPKTRRARLIEMFRRRK